jgi:hypothetical protein
MCGQQDLFGDLDETIQGLVTFGDTLKVPVKGKGNIPIKLKNENHSYIAYVYYVPAIKHNMLSIGQLIEKGYTLYMKNCHLTVKYYNGRLIVYVKMSKNKTFPLNIQYDAAKCLSVITNNEEWLWLLRLGHLNFTSLKMLASKKMVKGIPHIDHHRSSFAKEVNLKANKPLELVHTNMCDPIKPMSTGQNRYFLTFIDDFSKKDMDILFKEEVRSVELF